MKKTNIVFITTDQQRKDTLGCYGNSFIQTPCLDKMASEGIVFDRAYCESPICMPSRVTMITGKTARHHGVTLQNSRIRSDEPTVGEVLGNHGYRTHLIGKAHFKSKQQQGTEESIADWRSGKLAGWNGPYAGFETVDFVLGHSNSLVGHYGQWIREHHPDKAHFFKDTHLEPLDVSCGQGVYRNSIPEEVHSSTYVGNRACEFIHAMKEEDRPFYCMVNFPDPHWPIAPPQPFFDMYSDVDIPAPVPYLNEHLKENYPRTFHNAAINGKTRYDGGGHIVQDGMDIPKITKAYWGAITLIDKNVGRMMDALRECGMEENTLVVFTSDHGEYMGTHGMMAKGGFLWESLVNVPLLMKYPREIQAGRRTDALLSFVDLVPTMLDCANIDAGEMECDGLSQRPIMCGDEKNLRKAVTVFHPSQLAGPVSAVYDNDELMQLELIPDQHAIVTKDWKLVYFAGDRGGLMFHLADDPDERNNVYNVPVYREQQDRLTRRLLDELILQQDRRALKLRKNADHYGEHIMSYDKWKPEFDAIERETGLK